MTFLLRFVGFSLGASLTLCWSHYYVQHHVRGECTRQVHCMEEAGGKLQEALTKVSSRIAALEESVLKAQTAHP